MNGKDELDDEFYNRFRKREAKKATIVAAKDQPQKETKKHVDLRKKFCLGDLIRFSQFPNEDESVVATVIGYGKAYSILVGWRMGEKIPHTYHLASWEVSPEPSKFVNDWRMFSRMVWVSLPNDVGIIIDPRQPSQKEMDEAIDMLNEIKLLHFAPSKMDRYNHILDMKRTILGKFDVVNNGLVDAIKEDDKPKPAQFKESKA